MVTLDEEWTRPQQLLAAVVYRAWHPEPMSERFRWPTFYYMAHTMRVRHGIDAREVLESFPVLGSVGIGQAHYSAVFFDRLCPTNPEALVGLTVAGLAQAAGPDQNPAGFFLALLAHAGDQRRLAVVDPYEPQPVTITDQTFSRACCAVSPGVSMAMYELIRHEPSAATGLTPIHHNPADGSWTVEVGLPALDYTHNTALEDYLNRITRLHPTAPGPTISPGVDGDTRSFQVHVPGTPGMQVGEGKTQINNYDGMPAERDAQGQPDVVDETQVHRDLTPYPIDVATAEDLLNPLGTETLDFFVSHAPDDSPWAEWISWQLESAGYRVLVQAWDMVPGTNWARLVQTGLAQASRLIAVLSEAYVQSLAGAAQWQALWATDPDGTMRKVVPVRVTNCARPGLLAGIVGVDLFDIPEATAAHRLRRAAHDAMAGRAKPSAPPGFPKGKSTPDEASGAVLGALPPFPLDDAVPAAPKQRASGALSVSAAGDNDRAGRLFMHGLESLRAFALPSVSRLDLLGKVLDSTGPVPGSASLIIGEGGTGKSVLLGQLAEHLAEASDPSSDNERGSWAVVLLSCNAVPATADLTNTELADTAFAHVAHVPDPQSGLRVAVRDLAARFGGVYVLVDTLDVVLREETAHVVATLLGDLADRAQLFATCREREYRDLLMDPHLEVPQLGARSGHPALLVPRLAPPDILQWATRYSDTLNRPETERERFVASLKDAVRSAAVREVCAVPLRLAMACDLYGESGEIPGDLTITSLYDTYWARRIARDRQGRRTRRGDAQAQAALALAAAVVAQSRERLSLSVARATADDGTLRDGFAALLSEGVVREDGGRYEFFHQTYAEYTIARRLATSGSAEDLTQLRDALADPHSFLWPVARHLLMQASSAHRYRDLAEAVPTTTPEGALVHLLATRTRRSPELLLATARTIKDQDPGLLRSVAPTLADSPPECHDAALTIVVPMIGEADILQISELTRTAGVLLGRADSVVRAKHLPRALGLVQQREADIRQDIWLSLPANLVEPVCTQAPDADIRAMFHARYAQLGVRAQRALLRAQLAECRGGDPDGIDGLVTLAPAMLAAGCPSEMPEEEPVELLQRCWSHPGIRASLGWASWRDLLDADLPHRWDATQVRVAARLASDPSIRSELLADLLGDRKVRFPDRWINAAKFVADAHPTEVSETLGDLTGELPRRAVGALVTLSNQIADSADRRERTALIAVLARHRPADLRRVWGAQIKMAGPETDLQEELLTAFEASNAAMSTPGWPTIRTSALDTWLHVASPHFLASAGDRFRGLLPESGGKATVARAELEGRIAAIDATARDWVARQLLHGVSPTASGTAIVALVRSMQALFTTADPPLVDWITSMLASRHVDAARRLCELLADSAITPNDVLRDRAGTWPDRLGTTGGPAAVSLPQSVLVRLRAAVEAGEDSQLWSALLALMARLDAVSPMPCSTARAVLDLLTTPVRAIPRRLASGVDERLRAELASNLHRWVDVVGVIGGDHLPTTELETSVLDTLTGWDCYDLGQRTPRSVARVLLGLLHRNPAMAGRLADDWWPASGPGTKRAIAEALTVYERTSPGHRSVLLARRPDCPPDLATWIHARLRE
jgi:hypothetical protein